MKTLLAVVMLLATVAAGHAQYRTNNNYGYGSGGGYGIGSNPSSTYVQPHVNSNGSYTGGHYRTTPNSTTLDNYGTRGNYNPYTGTTGNRRGY